MGKQKKAKEAPAPLSEMERLGLRVSSMIGSPKAQLSRQALIHRLDTDSDEAWNAIMEVLAETDGLHLEFDPDGNALVSWDAPTEADERIEDMEAELMRVEVAEAGAPF